MTHIRIVSLATAAAALLLAGKADAQRQVNARHDAAANGTVEISINTGSVRVTGWNRNEVQVTGTLQRESDRVVLDGSGRTVEVRVQGGRGRGAGATLEVRVPAGSSLEVNTHAAPITVNGVTGAVEMVSQAGAITVQGRPRSVDAMSHAGAVTVDAETDRATITAMAGPVRLAGTVRQRAEITAMAGSVEVPAAVGEVEINALNGAVRVANVTGGQVEITSVSGTVNVTGTRLRGSVNSVSGAVVVTGSLGGALSVESHAGSVELRLPGNTGARVDINSFSGGVDSDWRLTRDGREWHGTLGRGGPTVSISTFSGSVKLSRR
jgi:DUF4097 and DUF4098 domain-containing protein YvlB